MPSLASNDSDNGVPPSSSRSYCQKHLRSVQYKSGSAETEFGNTQNSCLGNRMLIGIEVQWCPRGKLLTSLLRQAFRCNGLLDMKNCHVVSAQGWGPGSSGANCTLRINSRAEFLGSSRRYQDGTLCLAEAGVLHSHMLNKLKKPTDKWNKGEWATTLIVIPPFFIRAQLKAYRNTCAVTSCEFSLPNSLLKKLSPRSPPHSSARERGQLWNKPHLQTFKHLSVS